MLRSLLTRPRTSRLVNITCLLSLCANIFFLLSPRHVTKIVYNRQQLVNHRDVQRLDPQPAPGINDSLLEEDIKPGWGPTSVLEGQPGSGPTSVLEGERPPLNIARLELHNTNCTLCPYYPPKLLGPLADMTQDMTPADLTFIFPEIKDGRLRPSYCLPRERLAIVIPYRNRHPHLHILLHNLIPFLTRQQADASIFVVEQALPGTFNRGALLNAGFLEVEKIAMFDCFIFHDVDLIPLDDRHLYRCGDNPKHFAVAMNKYKFRLPYNGYFGGAVGFSRRQYLDINGCSNVYFGWGGEDDEMMQRALNSGYIITRSPQQIARYDMIKHNRDKGNEVNPIRKKILSSVKQRQTIDGLNTIRYKVNNIKVEQLYTWITVTFNQTEIIQSAPSYVLDAMMEAQRQVPTPSHRNVTAPSHRNVTTPSHRNVTATPNASIMLKPAVKTDLVGSMITSIAAGNVTRNATRS